MVFGKRNEADSFGIESFIYKNPLLALLRVGFFVDALFMVVCLELLEEITMCQREKNKNPYN